MTNQASVTETSCPHAAKSFWLRDYGDYRANEPLSHDTDCDVLVVGGGIFGLSAAWHAARDNVGDVMLIESEVIGFGASGRAAGWIMPQFGMDQLSIRDKYGKERSRAAIEYCLRAVSYTEELIHTHGIDSDFRSPGLMRVAFDDKWTEELHQLYELYQELGLPKIEWKSADSLAENFNGNTHFRAAIFDGNLSLLNPCKQVRALKNLAISAGVRIHENTPAVHIERSHGGVLIATPTGSIRAKKLVLATNAYTHMLEGPVGHELRRQQSPVFARGAVTEKLTAEQWQSIGWQSGCAIESSLDLFHYMAPTIDGRIQFYFIYFGGHPVRGELEPSVSHEGGQVSLAHLKCIFPQLEKLRLAHNWGGLMSGTRDLVPHLTHVGDERVIYMGGCWGHGLAIGHLHGQTVSHMLQERQTDLTDFWIVDRKPKPWPVFPLDWFSKQLVWKLLRRRTRRQIRNTIFASPGVHPDAH